MRMAGRDDPSVVIIREARDDASAQSNFRLAPSAWATQHRAHAFFQAGPLGGDHARLPREHGARGSRRLRIEQGRAGTRRNQRSARLLRRRRQRARLSLPVCRERVQASGWQGDLISAGDGCLAVDDFRHMSPSLR